MLPDKALIRTAIACKCPRCGTGDLYDSGFMTMTVRKECTTCGLELAKNDSADGPAVFLIFILGFLLVPLAIFFETTIHPPLWVHGLVWGTTALALTLGSLKPLKAYIIALQFKHRPDDWKDTPDAPP